MNPDSVDLSKELADNENQRQEQPKFDKSLNVSNSLEIQQTQSPIKDPKASQYFSHLAPSPRKSKEFAKSRLGRP